MFIVVLLVALGVISMLDLYSTMWEIPLPDLVLRNSEIGVLVQYCLLHPSLLGLSFVLSGIAIVYFWIHSEKRRMFSRTSYILCVK